MEMKIRRHFGRMGSSPSGKDQGVFTSTTGDGIGPILEPGLVSFSISIVRGRPRLTTTRFSVEVQSPNQSKNEICDSSHWSRVITYITKEKRWNGFTAWPCQRIY